MRQIDWINVDKSEWGKRPDPEIAAALGVAEYVIAYWRKKFGIPSYDVYFLEERSRQYDNGLAWCSTCKTFLPVDIFAKYKKGHYGLKAQCSNCQKRDYRSISQVVNERRRENYKQNRDDVLAYNKEHRNPAKLKVYNKSRNVQLKQRFVELAGGVCQRCKYQEFLSGLEFHHVDPLGKDATPRNVIYSGDYERAYVEIDKCALLCRNCHQAYHAEEWAAEFVKRDGLGWTISGLHS